MTAKKAKATKVKKKKTSTKFQQLTKVPKGKRPGTVKVKSIRAEEAAEINSAANEVRETIINALNSASDKEILNLVHPGQELINAIETAELKVSIMNAKYGPLRRHECKCDQCSRFSKD